MYTSRRASHPPLQAYRVTCLSLLLSGGETPRDGDISVSFVALSHVSYIYGPSVMRRPASIGNNSIGEIIA